MPCYHPLHMYFDRFANDGKEKHIFVDDNSILPFIDVRDGHIYSEARDVPCGQCIGCRLDRSREWALRCMLEAKEQELNGFKNYFVTLTYDDDHLPWNDVDMIEKYGTFDLDKIAPTLVKSDPAAFIKRLRSRLKYDYNFDGLRVYYSGEYGDLTKRPHYHLILFGLPADLEVIFYKNDKHGFPLYNVPYFDACWKKGYIVVGEVCYESCAYVARYVLKKQTGERSVFYYENFLEPEFCEMSRRPGIGKTWYDKHKYDLCYDFDGITAKGSHGKVMVHSPPRYFDKLFSYDDPDFMQEIKDSRCDSAKNRMRQVLSATSLSAEDYLKLREGNHFNAIKDMIREPDHIF